MPALVKPAWDYELDVMWHTSKLTTTVKGRVYASTLGDAMDIAEGQAAVLRGSGTPGPVTVKFVGTGTSVVHTTHRAATPVASAPSAPPGPPPNPFGKGFKEEADPLVSLAPSTTTKESSHVVH